MENYKEIFNVTEKEFFSKLLELQELYTNDESPLSDEEFDFLINYY